MNDGFTAPARSSSRRKPVLSRARPPRLVGRPRERRSARPRSSPGTWAWLTATARPGTATNERPPARRTRDGEDGAITRRDFPLQQASRADGQVLLAREQAWCGECACVGAAAAAGVINTRSASRHARTGCNPGSPLDFGNDDSNSSDDSPRPPEVRTGLQPCKDRQRQDPPAPRHATTTQRQSSCSVGSESMDAVKQHLCTGCPISYPVL
jgi:hypothetical protein